MQSSVAGGSLQPQAEPSPWLTVREAAEHSRLSQESIRRLLSGGQLTGYRPIRGRVLIARDELDNLIATATKSPRKGRGMHRRQAGC